MTDLLLDTHVFFWALDGDRRLTARGRRAIENAGSVRVSVVSLWEACVKAALGRLTLPQPMPADPARGFALAIEALGFGTLAIEAKHAGRLYALPMRHRDPFDRMLIAQAISEDATLMTADAAIAAYPEIRTVRP